MNDDAINSQQPKTLARLLKLDAEAPASWSSADLGPILQHQFGASLNFDLKDLAGAQHRSVEDLSRTPDGARLTTFAEALFHPHPPVELLGAIKDFARASGDEQRGTLPQEVATLLYYLSIVVVLVRCGRRITSLSDGALRKGVEWAIGQNWVDERTLATLREALEHLPAQLDG
jgi:hypothetical protein